MKKILSTYEFTLFLIIVGISIFIGTIKPVFLSFATLFNILNSAVPYFIMGVGVLMVLVIGEIDIAFVAIAALSSYGVNMMLLAIGYTGGIIAYLLTGLLVGMLLGMVEGLIVTWFELPVFFVSLGYQLMLYGFTLFFLGSTWNFNLPAGLSTYFTDYLVKVRNPVGGGNVGLQSSILFAIAIAVIVEWMLHYTLFGRSLYAMGGDRESARRMGFKAKSTIILVLSINGALAAIAGVIQSASNGYFDPTLFRGDDLSVIAYVVIGGASITGGRGTVIGTFLGVILIEILYSGLVYLGISADWQRLFLGIVLGITLSISVINAKRGRVRTL